MKVRYILLQCHKMSTESLELMNYRIHYNLSILYNAFNKMLYEGKINRTDRNTTNILN